MNNICRLRFSTNISLVTNGYQHIRDITLAEFRAHLRTLRVVTVVVGDLVQDSSEVATDLRVRSLLAFSCRAAPAHLVLSRWKSLLQRSVLLWMSGAVSRILRPSLRLARPSQRHETHAPSARFPDASVESVCVGSTGTAPNNRRTHICVNSRIVL